MTAPAQRGRFAARLRWGLVTGALWLSVSPLHLQADLIVKQQIEGAQSGEMTVQIKNGKSRADLAEPVSMITDAVTGETIVLQHAKKTFIRMPENQTKALAAQLLKAQAGTARKLDATGQRLAIGGHDCELHVWSVGALRMRFWVAKNYPAGAAVQAQLDQLQNQGLAAITASLMPKPSEMPGVRLRTELEVQGQKVTYTITSIVDTTVDPAVFAIPQDYREAPMSLGNPATR